MPTQGRKRQKRQKDAVGTSYLSSNEANDLRVKVSKRSTARGVVDGDVKAEENLCIG